MNAVKAQMDRPNMMPSVASTLLPQELEGREGEQKLEVSVIAFSTDSGRPGHPSLFACGCRDGTVAVFSLQERGISDEAMGGSGAGAVDKETLQSGRLVAQQTSNVRVHTRTVM
uniref:Uncharacterized protein n=1 Tax=Chromera velia CCMP2878 TaxID=1169474 RepID=A0A0G4FXM7_9ALVE|eukprot:Cvel_19203.t1-p1 / transcript=Cvel_19203.t1 / gene=Cvel_19203 / organism=Chromera_velia_CCMP2878 / gene_product=hypothetical protein / transcript_product=hypothetical protein / location=Cvel_scaffold1638:33808-34790(-) / protein_length=113 / sequence_SO=supercontig / SO=protein_coding / is_pseudo=false